MRGGHESPHLRIVFPLIVPNGGIGRRLKLTQISKERELRICSRFFVVIDERKIAPGVLTDLVNGRAAGGASAHDEAKLKAFPKRLSKPKEL